jgi:alkaline phosphatase D
MMRATRLHRFLPLCFCSILLPLVSGLALPDVAPAQSGLTHGPIVGGVTATTARILVRADSPTEVRYELDTDSAFANALLTEMDSARAERDYFTTIDIQNLSPDTKYYYRPVLNGVHETTFYHFTTFPTEGQTSTFTFAFGACQQNARDENSYKGDVFPLIVLDQPRFFLQLGDWTYPDTTDTREKPDDYFNVDFSRVQANYRSKYDPDYPMAELFRTTPIDYVYDDHDFSDNNSDMTYPGRQNSLHGYREMFPHYPLPNGENGLWHKFTFGNADFFVLDTRTQRHPNDAPFREDVSGESFYELQSAHLILEGDRTISGQLQMDWLIEQLKTSTADWKFICTSVAFNPANRAFMELALFFQGSELEELVRQIGYSSLDNIAKSIADSWNGFPGSVQRLVKAVNASNVENVIVLSGDSHTAAIDDGANSLFPEIMAGGLDRNNSRIVAIGELLGITIWNRGGQTQARANFNNHYGRVTVFGQDSVRMELIDDTGELIAAYTQPGGFLVSPVALSHAFETQDFGDVETGASSSMTLLLINTGADTVFVDNIASTIPEFSSNLWSMKIPPGVRTDVTIAFEPQSVDAFEGNLVIESNDPQSPIMINLRGRGMQPTSVTSRQANHPAAFALYQNYPNPFNASTAITFDVRETAPVSLKLYNVLGQEVATLVETEYGPGRHKVEFASDNLRSGIYFYVIGMGYFRDVRKMLLVQ